MNTTEVGQALIKLADVANCTGGDFHTIHLNLKGAEFDALHGQVFKKYYEAAGDDYDEFAEWAKMFDVPAPNKNGSGGRIGYESFEPSGDVDREEALTAVNDALDILLSAYVDLFKILNKADGDSRCIGAANMIQTKIEYWTKERHYFQKQRCS